jgi:diadenylate cyclase
MNKLHDGAVIIRNLRIAKAGVFFPMPEARVVDESFGSRHRAALGITEETDAVVVVVSEERGTISFCFNGNIAANLDGPKLRTMLETIFSPKVRKTKRRGEVKRPSVTPPIPEPPISVRTEERPPTSEPSPISSAAEAPGSLKGRPRIDSEPPPTPLRPRPSDAEARSAAAPLRTPTAALRGTTEIRASRPGTEGDDDKGGPSSSDPTARA